MQYNNPRLTNGYGIVSNTVIRDPDLSLRDKTIYAHLCTYANSQTNELTVGVSKIAQECGIDESTVKRALEQLEKKGIISRINRGQQKTRLTILLK